jgi:phosphoribosylformylglycinamidine cyclo-ligase
VNCSTTCEASNTGNYQLSHQLLIKMSLDAQKYALRGVSANKEDVHEAIKGLDKGLYPLAFCKILPDFVANDKDYCNIMHADTAGTKTSLAYLYWKETGDLSVWEGIVQDAIVMNLDDMGCVGCLDNIVLSSTIGRNKSLIPSEVVKALIQGTTTFVEKMKSYGINIELAGGETADVGDIVRTVDVGYTAFARLARKDLIINEIEEGDLIVGFSSYGKATYENTYNGGIGSNGLTSARHDVLSHGYAAQYPESFNPAIPLSVVYSGNKKLTDEIVLDNGEKTTVGKLLLSPTRTYLPLLKVIIQDLKPHISGIIHCTGGGQTKAMKFVENKHIVKNSLFALPKVFKLIQTESKTDYKEMYQVFNMGHRLEVYIKGKVQAEALIAIAKTFEIEAQIIGYVSSEKTDKNRLTINSPFGTFEY